MNTAYKAMSAQFPLHFQYHKISSLILVSVAKTHEVTSRLRVGIAFLFFWGGCYTYNLLYAQKRPLPLVSRFAKKRRIGSEAQNTQVGNLAGERLACMR